MSIRQSLVNEAWQFTRNYVMSNRTNPNPQQYVASLSGMYFTSEELNALNGRLAHWPGGRNAAVNAALQDLLNVRTSG